MPLEYIFALFVANNALKSFRHAKVCVQFCIQENYS